MKRYVNAASRISESDIQQVMDYIHNSKLFDIEWFVCDVNDNPAYRSFYGDRFRQAVVKKAINYLCDSEGGAFRRGAVNSDTVKNALWEMTEGYGEK